MNYPGPIRVKLNLIEARLTEIYNEILEEERNFACWDWYRPEIAWLERHRAELTSSLEFKNEEIQE